MDIAELFLSEPGPFIAVLAIAGGLSVAIISVVSNALAAMVRSVGQERSRREIAAYIAEGSMSPEEGERLLNAGHKDSRKSCWF